jgi:hypothetical protein
LATQSSKKWLKRNLSLVIENLLLQSRALPRLLSQDGVLRLKLNSLRKNKGSSRVTQWSYWNHDVSSWDTKDGLPQLRAILHSASSLIECLRWKARKLSRRSSALTSSQVKQ